MRAIGKRSMQPPSQTDAAQVPGKTHFAVIEKAGHVSFDKLQRNLLAIAVRTAKRMQSQTKGIPVERKLQLQLAGSCRRCAELLRASWRKDTLRPHRIEDLRVQLGVLDLMLECPSGRAQDRLTEWLEKTTGSMPIESLALTLDQMLDVIALFCEERSIRRPGRPRDDALRWLILCAQLSYEKVGGKVKPYWDEYSGHYRGTFLELMVELFRQAGLIDKPKDSLAQLIIEVARLRDGKSRKNKTPDEPRIANKRKS